MVGDDMANPQRGIKPVRYRIPRDKSVARPTAPRDSAADKEFLTGVVMGKKASAPEERLANALYKYNVNFQFRFVINGWGQKNTVATEVDFVIMNRRITPVQVYGSFAHKSREQIEIDREKEEQITEFFGNYGGRKCIGVPDIDLETEEQADLFVRKEIL